MRALGKMTLGDSKKNFMIALLSHSASFGSRSVVVDPISASRLKISFNFHLKTNPFCFSVYHMKESGWEHIAWTDVLDLHYQYKNQKK